MSTRNTGPIDPINDSEAVQMRKAGEGVIAYVMRSVGYSEENITNSLNTYYNAIAAELSDKILETPAPDIEPDAFSHQEDAYQAGLRDAAYLIDPNKEEDY